MRLTRLYSLLYGNTWKGLGYIYLSGGWYAVVFSDHIRDYGDQLDSGGMPALDFDMCECGGSSRGVIIQAVLLVDDYENWIEAEMDERHIPLGRSKVKFFFF